MKTGDDDAHNDEDGCPICMNDFDGQDIGQPESCDHHFCLDCIIAWAKNINTCPIDRKSFRYVIARHHGEEESFEKVKVSQRKQLRLEPEEESDLTFCEICGQATREDALLLCDGCDAGYHMDCLTPVLDQIPTGEWFCPTCGPRNTTALDPVAQPSTSTAATRTPATRRRRRVIPRTRAAERVRARVAQQIIADVDSEEDEDEEEEEEDYFVEPATTSTSPPTRGSRRRRGRGSRGSRGGGRRVPKRVRRAPRRKKAARRGRRGRGRAAAERSTGRTEARQRMEGGASVEIIEPSTSGGGGAQDGNIQRARGHLAIPSLSLSGASDTLYEFADDSDDSTYSDLEKQKTVKSRTFDAPIGCFANLRASDKSASSSKNKSNNKYNSKSNNNNNNNNQQQAVTLPASSSSSALGHSNNNNNNNSTNLLDSLIHSQDSFLRTQTKDIRIRRSDGRLEAPAPKLAVPTCATTTATTSIPTISGSAAYTSSSTSANEMSSYGRRSRRGLLSSAESPPHQGDQQRSSSGRQSSNTPTGGAARKSGGGGAGADSSSDSWSDKYGDRIDENIFSSYEPPTSVHTPQSSWLTTKQSSSTVAAQLASAAAILVEPRQGSSRGSAAAPSKSPKPSSAASAAGRSGGGDSIADVDEASTFAACQQFCRTLKPGFRPGSGGKYGGGAGSSNVTTAEPDSTTSVAGPLDTVSNPHMTSVTAGAGGGYSGGPFSRSVAAGDAAGKATKVIHRGVPPPGMRSGRSGAGTSANAIPLGKSRMPLVTGGGLEPTAPPLIDPKGGERHKLDNVGRQQLLFPHQQQKQKSPMNPLLESAALMQKLQSGGGDVGTQPARSGSAEALLTSPSKLRLLEERKQFMAELAAQQRAKLVRGGEKKAGKADGGQSEATTMQQQIIQQKQQQQQWLQQFALIQQQQQILLQQQTQTADASDSQQNQVQQALLYQQMQRIRAAAGLAPMAASMEQFQQQASAGDASAATMLQGQTAPAKDSIESKLPWNRAAAKQAEAVGPVGVPSPFLAQMAMQNQLSLNPSAQFPAQFMIGTGGLMTQQECSEQDSSGLPSQAASSAIPPFLAAQVFGSPAVVTSSPGGGGLPLEFPAVSFASASPVEPTTTVVSSSVEQEQQQQVSGTLLANFDLENYGDIPIPELAPGLPDNMVLDIPLPPSADAAPPPIDIPLPPMVSDVGEPKSMVDTIPLDSIPVPPMMVSQLDDGGTNLEQQHFAGSTGEPEEQERKKKKKKKTASKREDGADDGVYSPSRPESLSSDDEEAAPPTNSAAAVSLESEYIPSEPLELEDLESMNDGEAARLSLLLRQQNMAMAQGGVTKLVGSESINVFPPPRPRYGPSNRDTEGAKKELETSGKTTITTTAAAVAPPTTSSSSSAAASAVVKLQLKPTSMMAARRRQDIASRSSVFAAIKSRLRAEDSDEDVDGAVGSSSSRLLAPDGSSVFEAERPTPSLAKHTAPDQASAIEDADQTTDESGTTGPGAELFPVAKSFPRTNVVEPIVTAQQPNNIKNEVIEDFTEGTDAAAASELASAEIDNGPESTAPLDDTGECNNILPDSVPDGSPPKDMLSESLNAGDVDNAPENEEPNNKNEEEGTEGQEIVDIEDKGGEEENNIDIVYEHVTKKKPRPNMRRRSRSRSPLLRSRSPSSRRRQRRQRRSKSPLMDSVNRRRRQRDSGSPLDVRRRRPEDSPDRRRRRGGRRSPSGGGASRRRTASPARDSAEDVASRSQQRRLERRQRQQRGAPDENMSRGSQRGDGGGSRRRSRTPRQPSGPSQNHSVPAKRQQSPATSPAPVKSRQRSTTNTQEADVGRRRESPQRKSARNKRGASESRRERNEGGDKKSRPGQSADRNDDRQHESDAPSSKPGKIGKQGRKHSWSSAESDTEGNNQQGRETKSNEDRQSPSSQRRPAGGPFPVTHDSSTAGGGGTRRQTGARRRDSQSPQKDRRHRSKDEEPKPVSLLDLISQTEEKSSSRHRGDRRHRRSHMETDRPRDNRSTPADEKHGRRSRGGGDLSPERQVSADSQNFLAQHFRDSPPESGELSPGAKFQPQNNRPSMDRHTAQEQLSESPKRVRSKKKKKQRRQEDDASQGRQQNSPRRFQEEDDHATEPYDIADSLLLAPKNSVDDVTMDTAAPKQRKKKKKKNKRHKKEKQQKEEELKQEKQHQQHGELYDPMEEESEVKEDASPLVENIRRALSPDDVLQQQQKLLAKDQEPDEESVTRRGRSLSPSSLNIQSPPAAGRGLASQDEHADSQEPRRKHSHQRDNPGSADRDLESQGDDADSQKPRRKRSRQRDNPDSMDRDRNVNRQDEHDDSQKPRRKRSRQRDNPDSMDRDSNVDRQDEHADSQKPRLRRSRQLDNPGSMDRHRASQGDHADSQTYRRKRSRQRDNPVDSMDRDRESQGDHADSQKPRRKRSRQRDNPDSMNRDRESQGDHADSQKPRRKRSRQRDNPDSMDRDRESQGDHADSQKPRRKRSRQLDNPDSVNRDRNRNGQDDHVDSQKRRRKHSRQRDNPDSGDRDLESQGDHVDSQKRRRKRSRERNNLDSADRDRTVDRQDDHADSQRPRRMSDRREPSDATDENEQRPPPGDGLIADGFHHQGQEGGYDSSFNYSAVHPPPGRRSGFEVEVDVASGRRRRRQRHETDEGQYSTLAEKLGIPVPQRSPSPRDQQSSRHVVKHSPNRDDDGEGGTLVVDDRSGHRHGRLVQHKPSTSPRRPSYDEEFRMEPQGGDRYGREDQGEQWFEEENHPQQRRSPGYAANEEQHRSISKDKKRKKKKRGKDKKEHRSSRRHHREFEEEKEHRRSSSPQETPVDDTSSLIQVQVTDRRRQGRHRVDTGEVRLPRGAADDRLESPTATGPEQQGLVEDFQELQKLIDEEDGGGAGGNANIQLLTQHRQDDDETDEPNESENNKREAMDRSEQELIMEGLSSPVVVCDQSDDFLVISEDIEQQLSSAGSQQSALIDLSTCHPTSTDNHVAAAADIVSSSSVVVTSSVTAISVEQQQLQDPTSMTVGEYLQDMGFDPTALKPELVQVMSSLNEATHQAQQGEQVMAAPDSPAAAVPHSPGPLAHNTPPPHRASRFSSAPTAPPPAASADDNSSAIESPAYRPVDQDSVDSDGSADDQGLVSSVLNKLGNAQQEQQQTHHQLIQQSEFTTAPTTFTSPFTSTPRITIPAPPAASSEVTIVVQGSSTAVDHSIRTSTAEPTLAEVEHIMDDVALDKGRSLQEEPSKGRRSERAVTRIVDIDAELEMMAHIVRHPTEGSSGQKPSHQSSSSGRHHHQHRHHHRHSSPSQSASSSKQDRLEKYLFGDAPEVTSTTDNGKDNKKRDDMINKISRHVEIEKTAKEILKPYYEGQEITKEEYKEIMKKVVTQLVSKCKHRGVNVEKAEQFIAGYVTKMQKKRMKAKEQVEAELDSITKKRVAY